MANHTTRAQRINARQDKIYETAMRLRRERDKTDEISKSFATTDSLTFSPYYAVQALVGGRCWSTFFAPYLTADDAIAMRDHLAEKNPACQYQAIKVETL